MLKILFMGTPDFAAASLKALYESNANIAGVFTQPDKPKGRGMEMSFSPVKELAVAHGTPVYQPEKLRDGTACEIIRNINPDIIVVVAYGRIIPDDILAIPEYGTINVHGSLLPKYRGAAPIQWSVINGDEITGVTTMYLATEMDAGDIIYSESTKIGTYETSGDLFERLKIMGAELLIKTLKDIECGKAPRTAQDHSLATYAPMLDKSMSPIDFNQNQKSIIKKVYGLQPWPVATMELNGDTIKVFEADYCSITTKKEPGKIVAVNDSGIAISCAEGNTVIVKEIQLPGKRRMKVSEYLKGHRLSVDE